MRPLLCMLAVVFSCQVFSQERQTATFGEPSSIELNMKSYPKDPEAAGVVLFETGRNSVQLVNDRIRLIKEVFVKMKVLDAKNFDHATVTIPYYVGGKFDEKVQDIKAITHNGTMKTYLKPSNIFTEDPTQNWALKKFTFPNVQDGSVLEYSYTIESPYFSHLGGWDFQSTIPKMYTEFESEIPGNYVYRRSLLGSEPLYINKISVKKNCFWLPGIAQNADCEWGQYAMKDVPAFKTEKYMLSEKNYMARIKYELKEYTDVRGNKTEITREWKDVDKEFRTDRDLGRQLGYKNFFENNLPPNILAIKDPMEKGKAIYYFIQDHFNYNGKQRILTDIRVKEAFEEKVGNSSEINLSLINALEAAGLDAFIVLISTRDRALPTKGYPVLTDFNYALALLKIGDTNYLLDATSKFTPFAVLPYPALNKIGRVLDNKNGSYWIDILPKKKNVTYINAQLSFTENNEVTGKVSETYVGYPAMEERKQIVKLGKEDHKKEKEKLTFDTTINDFNIENLNNVAENLKETYTLEITPETTGDKLYLSPFFLRTFYDENPFKLNERNYPVEFGFPYSETFLMSLDLNNQYTITEIPQNTIVKLPNGAGECSVVYGATGGKLSIRFSLKVNEYYFTPEKYQSLKEFFDAVVTKQNKEVVVLEKI
ncbi:DUF3857 domain-containing protein [Marinirhabdus gelatinilytica]|uniref:Uncharacterized protein DUF3857 n=1 Tax=Marinirhabdus gelatinilytica TaxID=1703343 RepID=A0A370Q4J1_9FLAO|nr:DUF3857 domain-containing protein [Marinirhabdus gelatinilytica]RDK83254.1 uncharacterized protein DUF3857 [Marinirhabdus gelatinilytica]